jgi:hypothetical protein
LVGRLSVPGLRARMPIYRSLSLSGAPFAREVANTAHVVAVSPVPRASEAVLRGVQPRVEHVAGDTVQVRTLGSLTARASWFCHRCRHPVYPPLCEQLPLYCYSVACAPNGSGPGQRDSIYWLQGCRCRVCCLCRSQRSNASLRRCLYRALRTFHAQRSRTCRTY